MQSAGGCELPRLIANVFQDVFLGCCVQESSEEETSSDEEMTAQTYAVNVALFKSKLKDSLFRMVA